MDENSSSKIRVNILWMLILFFIFANRSFAQLPHINLDRIHSLQILVNNIQTNFPSIILGDKDHLQVSFDDMTKEYHRYVYKVEHCDFNWNVSTRIFESDYLQGSDTEIPIENYHESLNTTVAYTHYSFNFPNNRMAVSLSGNYRIRIFDDDDDKEVCSICFFVVEPKVNVNATVTTNTDIDWNQKNQQIKVYVNSQSLNSHDPSREIKIVVYQNGRWDNAVLDPTADYYTPSDIRWEHNNKLIFNGGNEFRKFEMTNLKFGLMGIDNISWFRPYYHATLFENKDRKNYVYDEDKDGLYYISATDRTDDNYECDYVLVHFFLKHVPETSGSFYINGALSNWSFSPEYKMQYNPANMGYEATLLLKEGYYNYQYLFLPNNNNMGLTEQAEGNFYQTENEYTILVYYSQRGARYDRLVGVRNFVFAPSKQ